MAKRSRKSKPRSQREYIGKELGAVRAWIVRLEDGTGFDSRWRDGMLRHYREREAELAAAHDALMREEQAGEADRTSDH